MLESRAIGDIKTSINGDDDEKGDLSKFVFGDEEYRYLKSHIHVGQSEHLFEDYSTNGTAHIIHINKDEDKLVVLGLPYVFAEDGHELPFTCPQRCWDGSAFKTEQDLICPDDNRSFDGKMHRRLLETRVYEDESLLNLMSGLQELNLEDYYGYFGRLTTPSCDNNIFFVIKKVPIKIKDWKCEDVANAFVQNNGINGNYRAVQEKLPQTRIFKLAGKDSHVNHLEILNSHADRVVTMEEMEHAIEAAIGENMVYDALMLKKFHCLGCDCPECRELK